MSFYNPSPSANDECPSFHPPLKGCVARDVRFALALEPCCNDALSAIATQTYRAIRVREYDCLLSDLFEWIGTEEQKQFRLLGELILALGGNGKLHVAGRLRNDPPIPNSSDLCTSLLNIGITEKQKTIDRYETLLTATQDRVVRSVISKLLGNERRMSARLENARNLS